MLDRADLVPVPDGVSAEAAETVVVNGVTAWRMLHRGGEGRARADDRRPGRGRRRRHGARPARAPRGHPRDRHRAGRSSRSACASSARRRSTIAARTSSRACASWRRTASRPSSTTSAARASTSRGGCSRAAGRSSSYGTAATKDVPGNPQIPVLKLLAKLTVWNVLPNGRSATFFNLWEGHRFGRDRFRARAARGPHARLRAAARRRDHATDRGALRLEHAAEALRFAEAGGNTGKVLLLP